jgi:hypothetical protein
VSAERKETIERLVEFLQGLRYEEVDPILKETRARAVASDLFDYLEEKGFEIVQRDTSPAGIRARLGIEERLDRIWRAEAALAGRDEPGVDDWISADLGRFKKVWQVRGLRDGEGDPALVAAGETLEEAISKYELALKLKVQEQEELLSRPKRARTILDTGFLGERVAQKNDSKGER